MSHKFRMDAPFLDGISYLSREEEATARQIAINRQSKASVAEIDLKESDAEAVAFVQRIRSEIDTWKNLPEVRLSACLVYADV
jgi:poly(A)-specific ribonuclease